MGNLHQRQKQREMQFETILFFANGRVQIFSAPHRAEATQQEGSFLCALNCAMFSLRTAFHAHKGSCYNKRKTAAFLPTYSKYKTSMSFPCSVYFRYLEHQKIQLSNQRTTSLVCVCWIFIHCPKRSLAVHTKMAHMFGAQGNKDSTRPLVLVRPPNATPLCTLTFFRLCVFPFSPPPLHHVELARAQVASW